MTRDYRLPENNPMIPRDLTDGKPLQPCEPGYDGRVPFEAAPAPIAADVERDLASVEELEVDAGAGLMLIKMADGHWRTADRRTVADLAPEELKRLAAWLRSRAV